MEDQRIAAIRLDQAIFGAAAKPGYARAGEALAQICWDRAAQVCSPWFDPGQYFVLQHGGYPAHGRLDFGQFRHGFALAAAPPLG